MELAETLLQFDLLFFSFYIWHFKPFNVQW